MRVLSGFAGFMALFYAGLAISAVPAPAPKADLERGKQIATTVCVACHGPDGNSPAPANPVLAGQHGDYIALQLQAFKTGARPSPIMQGMAAGLSPEDMHNLGAYFEAQKPAERVARDPALVKRGEQIWRGGIRATAGPACAGCHGAAGKGIPAQFPRLANQYPEQVFGWLKAYASGARPHGVMGPIAAKLNENDMKALSEYTAGLR
jgi:cytochrome c553